MWNGLAEPPVKWLTEVAAARNLPCRHEVFRASFDPTRGPTG